MPQNVTVALDWTPNGNHAGFYVARFQGLYAKAGLDVSFISPSVDGYKATPASRVESGEAIFAITPSETIISLHTRPAGSAPKPKLQAVAALLQEDTSAIVALKGSGIDRPSKLDGKRYASYAARYEGRIVQEMIKKDGGSGDYQELVLPMLGLWNTILAGEADATWVFLAWEGIEAAKKGVELNVFRLKDYGIPYGYSPVLVAHPDTLNEKPDIVKAFLDASAQGFKYAAAHPAEAGKILYELGSAENPDLPTPLDLEICKGSVEATAENILDSQGRWGHMEESRWSSFLDWLSSSGLLTAKLHSRTPVEGVSTTLDGLRAGEGGEIIPRESVNAASLFSNAYLPQ